MLSFLPLGLETKGVFNKPTPMSRPQDTTHETQKTKPLCVNNIPKMRCETGSCEMFSFALFFGSHGHFKGCTWVGLVETIARKVVGGGGRGSPYLNYLEKARNSNVHGTFQRLSQWWSAANQSSQLLQLTSQVTDSIHITFSCTNARAHGILRVPTSNSVLPPITSQSKWKFITLCATGK